MNDLFLLLYLPFPLLGILATLYVWRTLERYIEVEQRRSRDD